MGKNIAIAVLSVALFGSLSGAAIGWMMSVQQAAKMRASYRLVRVSGYEVWKLACQHAAAGNKQRENWCAAAERETAVTAREEGVSDDDMEALALAYVLKHDTVKK